MCCGGHRCSGQGHRWLWAWACVGLFFRSWQRVTLDRVTTARHQPETIPTPAMWSSFLRVIFLKYIESC